MTAVSPWTCALPLWPRLTLPLALPFHHDVPVQRPGHGVGKLGALQERRHGAVRIAGAVGARLCHRLPDLGLGLWAEGVQGRSSPVRREGRPLAVPVTCPEPAVRPPAAAPARTRAGVSSLGTPAPFPASPGPAPPYPFSLRFLRGLLRALAAASHPVTA